MRVAFPGGGGGQGNLRGLLLYRSLAGWFTRQRASESYLPSPATHRDSGEAWPLSDKEPADPVVGRGRRVADGCPEMGVLQQSLCRDCEPDKDKQRSSLL